MTSKNSKTVGSPLQLTYDDKHSGEYICKSRATDNPAYIDGPKIYVKFRSKFCSKTFVSCHVMKALMYFFYVMYFILYVFMGFMCAFVLTNIYYEYTLS